MSTGISKKFNSASLLKFVLPSMLMMVVTSLYTMTGSIYVGNFVNQNAMAAINIVAPLFGVVIATSVMFATGSNAIIAKNLGEGNTLEAKEKLSYLFIIAILTGIVMSLLTNIFMDPILKFLGSTPELNAYAKIYLRTLSISFPFIFLQIFGQYYTVTIGKPSLGLVFSIISIVSNIFLTHILIVYLGVGIVGAAIGFGSSFIIPGIIFTILLAIKKDWSLHFVKPKKYPNFIKDVCFNGSSEMVTNLAISIVTMTLNLLMGRLHGENGIAAVTVIVSLQFFLNSMYIGFGAGVAPIFSFAQGTNNRTQTKSVFKTSIVFVGGSSIILVVLCFLFKRDIVSIFINSSSPAYKLAINAFSIFSIGYLFAGMNIFASVFFTSVSNGKMSALISFLRTFAFILGMLTILPRLMGTMGIWLSIPVAELLAIGVSLTLLKKHKSVYHY